MPTTPPPASPALRIHRPVGRDDAPWPPPAGPGERPGGRDDAAWLRYGRVPNGVPAGCYLDVAVHQGRPPAGIDALYDHASDQWVSLRIVDPLDEAVMGHTGRGA